MTGKMNNFQITACDTDSVFFKKHDKSFFTKEERLRLLEELNSLMPKKIVWELNDYFSTLITLKAKNYVMQTEDGKVKYKGSGLKSSKLEPALKEFLYKIIDSILEEKYEYQKIYQEYIAEILNLNDIKRWVSKKTISAKTLTSERTNETKIKDAIQGKEIVEGDKVLLYFTKDDKLKVIEDYSNDHDEVQLLGRLYSVSKIFTHIDNKPIGILPKETFLNYSLVKNYKVLKGLK